MSRNRLDPADLDHADLERLAKLPAWERAQLYDLADLDLGMRSLVELEVRTRIRAAFEREHGRGRRRAAR